MAPSATSLLCDLCTSTVVLRASVSMLDRGACSPLSRGPMRFSKHLTGTLCGSRKPTSKTHLQALESGQCA